PLVVPTSGGSTHSPPPPLSAPSHSSPIPHCPTPSTYAIIRLNPSGAEKLHAGTQNHSIPTQRHTPTAPRPAHSRAHIPRAANHRPRTPPHPRRHRLRCPRHPRHTSR